MFYISYKLAVKSHRLSCPELFRLMLDWGADAQGGGVGNRSMAISRSYSMATRSLTSKQIKSGRN